MDARYVGHRDNSAAINHLFRDDDGPVGRDLQRSSALVLAEARRLVGVRSTVLITSLRRERGQDPRGPYVDVVGGRRGLTGYIMDHHDGTEPHTIRPRRRRALRFIAGGRVVFATRVHHPGTRGTRFLARALDVLR